MIRQLDRLVWALIPASAATCGGFLLLAALERIL